MIISTRESGIPAGDGEYSPEWAIAKAKELGLGGIELSISPRPMTRRPPSPDLVLPNRRRAPARGVWPEALDQDQRQRLRETAAASGVAIASLSMEWVWGYSPFHTDLKEGWERGLELLKQSMELTADLGAKACLIPSFGVATGTWDQAKRLLSETAEVAARRGVVAGVEGSIWWRAGLGDEAELLKMIDEIGSPGLGVYGHPQSAGRGNADEIRMLGKHLVCMHHFAMTPERVDYPAMFAAMREVGYDYAWVFEVDDQELPRSKRTLDELLAKYWHD